MLFEVMKRSGLAFSKRPICLILGKNSETGEKSLKLNGKKGATSGKSYPNVFELNRAFEREPLINTTLHSLFLATDDLFVTRMIW
ncbi:MAG: hypothetical protein HKP52_11270 [Desulfofustis sp.]|nr:hypothetical protein [Desulfofustis sp.]NNK14807.1 hypothetical protein [Desulfofustis sp.]